VAVSSTWDLPPFPSPAVLILQELGSHRRTRVIRGLRTRTATHVFGGGPFAMSSAVPRGKEWKRYPCAEEHEKMSELYLQTLVPAYLGSTLSCDNRAIFFFFCVCVLNHENDPIVSVAHDSDPPASLSIPIDFCR
jgi:hypothetical protein